MIYFKIKDYENSIKFFINTVSIKPDFQTYVNLAVIYKQIGKVDKYIEYLKEALIIKDDKNVKNHLFNALQLKTK